VPHCRYNCNRYNEDEAKKARNAQEVCSQFSVDIFDCYFTDTVDSAMAGHPSCKKIPISALGIPTEFLHVTLMLPW